MDWVALIAVIASALISVGVIMTKGRNTQVELTEFKENFTRHQDRDNIRFDDVTRRMNDQEVAHQAIHTSLQFIMAKLDKIEESVRS